MVTVNAATACLPAGSANQPISVLLVGSSLLDDVQAGLDELLNCRGYTPGLATSNPAGHTLELHDTDTQTTDLIAEGFDLTLLQEHISDVATHSSPYLVIESLKTKIEAAGSSVGFYQTWGLRDREPVATEDLLLAYEGIAAQFNAPIVRVGRAWDYFYTLHSENPPFSLYADAEHPTQEGMALISYVLYAYLTGDSPIDTPRLGLSADNALLLQTVAWDSYQAYP